MTTIAYHHQSRMIAIDSRRTMNEVIVSDNDVKYLLNDADGSMWFLCGQISDQPKLLAVYNGGPIKDKEIEANAFYIKDGVVYRCGVIDEQFWVEPVTFNSTMGSGWKFALAAMDFHYSAEAAVDYAKTRDNCTGGETHVYDINKGEFI